MKGLNIDTGLALVQEILGVSKLTEVQEAVFRGVWMKQSYQDIIDAAAEHGYYYKYLDKINYILASESSKNFFNVID